MCKAKKLTFIVMLMLALSCCVSISHAADEPYHYATTNMTWAEFYAGEIGVPSADLAASYDAVTTATTRFAGRFAGFIASSSDAGTTFTGVKDVQVRMTDDVYNEIADKSRFTFVNEVFDEYKEAAPDGTFSDMETKTVSANDVTVALSGGKSNGHGNYRLTLTGLSYDKLGADLGTNNINFLGAKLTTTDGTVYGLKPLHNLWIRDNMAAQIGFNVVDFTEFNGSVLTSAHTADISGKTIETITYMLKNQPDIEIACDVYVKQWTEAAITVSGDVKTGSNAAVTLAFKDIPTDADYQLSSVAKVVGRSSTPLAETDYTYSNGVLTFTNLEAGSYTATFSDNSATPYVDITASISASNYYATTNMTWAEFYAGETGKTASELEEAGLDAITTPTTGKFKRFPLLWGLTSPDYAGTLISGEKDVAVSMTGDIYNALTEEQKARYNFIDETPSEYKPVNADGSFGKMVTQVTKTDTAIVELASGASSRWGHYTLTVSSVDINIGLSGDKTARNYLGATITTKDGTVYGMRHDNNLWSDTGVVAFCISGDYVEPHGNGVLRSWKYTKPLEGQTITNITFMLKGLPDVSVSCDVYVPPMSVTAEADTDTVTFADDTDATVTVTFTGAEAGDTFTLDSLKSGSGKGAAAISEEFYSFDGSKLTLKPALASGSYTAIFHNDKYADVSVTFTVKGLYRYATTNMTYSEFYLGEIGETANELDAVTSPTIDKVSKFGDVISYDISDGTTINYIADVQVRMTDEVYSQLSADKALARYKFSTAPFAEYKDVTGKDTFSRMETESKDVGNVDVTVKSGASGVWGNYYLTLSSTALASLDVSNKYMGLVVETSDGKKYGLQHLWNFVNFKKNELAFCVTDFTESHGVSPAYTHTAGLAGKIITKITYMLKNAPDWVITCNVKLPELSETTVSLTDGKAAAGQPTALTFTGLPEGVSYAPTAFYTGSGRQRTNIDSGKYTFVNNILTVSDDVPAGNYTITLQAEGYTDISFTFYLEGMHYATTDMTWAEFYAAEVTDAETLDAISSSTPRIGARFSQLTSESNNIGGLDITGVKAVQVRMSEEVYQALSKDERYTWSDKAFAEYKDVNDDGTFGKMETETDEVFDAVVSLSSGGGAVWGNYVLEITSVDISLGSGDTSDYLGVLVTTSDGNVYGMRHNNNLWFQAKDIALSVQAFTEPHGVSRNYAHTSDMAGKTITQVQYMLKNKPDVVVYCDNIYLKPLTNAKAAIVEPAEGWIVPMSSPAFTVEITSADRDANYKASTVYRSYGHHNREEFDFTYSDGVLTISGDLMTPGAYTVLFDSEKYASISASFTLYTTEATSLIVSPDKNGAGLDFLLTPRGAMKAVDEELDANKFVNATDYTKIAENSTEVYKDAGIDGFTVNVGVAGVSEDYTAVLGFSRTAVLTKDTLADNYQKIYNAISMTPVMMGYHIIEPSALNNAGLRAVLLNAEGKSRDITEYTSAGAMIDGDTLYLVYGAMAADSASVEEGTYMLSPEGENLINDGVRDGKIAFTFYLEEVEGAASVAPTTTHFKQGEPVAVTFENADGVTYQVGEIYAGFGDEKVSLPTTGYTYTDGKLTLNGVPGGNYTVTFGAEGQPDLSFTIYVEGDHYALTDMTFAEFYAGEVEDTDATKLDAITTPTVGKAARFGVLDYEADDDGTTIYGIADVQVKMTEAVYQTLSGDERYTFVNEAFGEYKDVTAKDTFGRMYTGIIETPATVTLASGATATWGNYVLIISADLGSLTSGDERYLIGALVKTDDGKVYAMRHNNNLWLNAKEMAISVAEFKEPHGAVRSYAHTSDMAGKKIISIQYMLKNKPDLVFTFDEVFLKNLTDATAEALEPEGGWLIPQHNPEITIDFEGLPENTNYKAISVYRSYGHHEKEEYGFKYADNVLTISGDVFTTGSYTAVFADDKYSDLTASFTYYTTDATSLIVSGDNNAAGLNFLLTPKGAMKAIDDELASKKLVNASEVTTIASNKTVDYAQGVSGSGFSFDIVVDVASDDYTAVVGFGKMFTMTRTALGANYQRVYDAINAIPVGDSGWKEIPAVSQLNSVGIRAIAVQSDGTSRDVSSLVGTGAMIDGGNIMLFYGVMAADSASLAEGEYMLSPEGETLINDGVRDGHITLAMYIESTPPSGSGGGTSGGGSSTTTSDDNPAPAPAPVDSDDTPAPTPTPAPTDSDDTPAPAPTPAPGGDDDTPTPGGDDTPAPTPAPGGDDTPAPTPAPGGDDTPSVTPQPAAPSRPGISLTVQSIVDTIVNALQNILAVITGDTEVLELSENATVGEERDIDSVSDEELAEISESGEEPAAVLPVMRVEKAAVYVFGVDLRHLRVGALIFMHMFAEADSTGGASVRLSAETEDAYTFLDDDGNETKTVPVNQHVNVAAYMEPGMTYAPVITVASDSNSGGDTSGGGNSGGDDTPVTPVTPDNPDTPAAGDPGSSGGGCNDFGAVAPALMLAVLLMIARKK